MNTDSYAPAVERYSQAMESFNALALRFQRHSNGEETLTPRQLQELKDKIEEKTFLVNLLKKSVEAAEHSVKFRKALVPDPAIVKTLDQFDPQVMLIDEFLGMFETQIPLHNFESTQKILVFHSLLKADTVKQDWFLHNVVEKSFTWERAKEKIVSLVTDQEKEQRRKVLKNLKALRGETLASFAVRFIKLYHISYGNYNEKASLDEKPLFEKYFDSGTITTINATAIANPLMSIFDLVYRYVTALPADYELKHQGSGGAGDKEQTKKSYCVNHGMCSHSTSDCREVQKNFAASREKNQQPKPFGQRSTVVHSCRMWVVISRVTSVYRVNVKSYQETFGGFLKLF